MMITTATPANAGGPIARTSSAIATRPVATPAAWNAVVGPLLRGAETSVVNTPGRASQLQLRDLASAEVSVNCGPFALIFGTARET